jgi:hypothetical protein
MAPRKSSTPKKSSKVIKTLIKTAKTAKTKATAASKSTKGSPKAKAAPKAKASPKAKAVPKGNVAAPQAKRVPAKHVSKQALGEAFTWNIARSDRMEEQEAVSLDDDGEPYYYVPTKGSELAEHMIGKDGTTVAIDHMVRACYSGKVTARERDIIFVGLPGFKITASDALQAFRDGAEASFHEGRSYAYSGVGFEKAQVSKLIKKAYKSKFGQELPAQARASLMVATIGWDSWARPSPRERRPASPGSSLGPSGSCLL